MTMPMMEVRIVRVAVHERAVAADARAVRRADRLAHARADDVIMGVGVLVFQSLVRMLVTVVNDSRGRRPDGVAPSERHGDLDREGLGGHPVAKLPGPAEAAAAPGADGGDAEFGVEGCLVQP